MSIRTVIELALQQERKRQKDGDKYAAARWGVYARILDLLNAEQDGKRFEGACKDILGPTGGVTRTDKERICKLVGLGLMQKDVAEVFGVHPATVQTYMRRSRVDSAPSVCQ